MSTFSEWVSSKTNDELKEWATEIGSTRRYLKYSLIPRNKFPMHALFHAISENEPDGLTVHDVFEHFFPIPEIVSRSKK